MKLSVALLVLALFGGAFGETSSASAAKEDPQGHQLWTNRACTGNNQCVRGFFCNQDDAATRGCVPRRLPGEACKAHHQCAGHLFCDGGKCQRRLGYGSKCKQTRQCRTHLYCQKNSSSGELTCQRRLKQGSRCTIGARHGRWSVPKSECARHLVCAKVISKKYTTSQGVRQVVDQVDTICKRRSDVDIPCHENYECRGALYCGKRDKKQVEEVRKEDGTASKKTITISSSVCKRRKARGRTCETGNQRSCRSWLYCKSGEGESNSHNDGRCFSRIQAGSDLACNDKTPCMFGSYCDKDNKCKFKGGLNNCQLHRRKLRAKFWELISIHPCGLDMRSIWALKRNLAVFCTKQRSELRSLLRQKVRTPENKEVDAAIQTGRVNLSQCLADYRKRSEDLVHWEVKLKATEDQLTTCERNSASKIASLKENIATINRERGQLQDYLDKMSCTKYDRKEANLRSYQYFGKTIEAAREVDKSNKLRSCFMLSRMDPNFQRFCPLLDMFKQSPKKGGDAWCAAQRKRTRALAAKYYNAHPCKQQLYALKTAIMARKVAGAFAHKVEKDNVSGMRNKDEKGEFAITSGQSDIAHSQIGELQKAVNVASQDLETCERKKEALIKARKLPLIRQQLTKMKSSLRANCPLDEKSRQCAEMRRVKRVLKSQISGAACMKVYKEFHHAHGQWKILKTSGVQGEQLKLAEGAVKKAETSLGVCYAKNKKLMISKSAILKRLRQVNHDYARNCLRKQRSVQCTSAADEFHRKARSFVASYRSSNPCSKSQQKFRDAVFKFKEMKKSGSQNSILQKGMQEINTARTVRLACYRKNLNGMRTAVASLQDQVTRARTVLNVACRKFEWPVTRGKCSWARKQYGIESKKFNTVNPCREEFASYALARKIVAAHKHKNLSAAQIRESLMRLKEARVAAQLCRRKKRNNVIDAEQPLRKLAKFLVKCSKEFGASHGLSHHNGDKPVEHLMARLAESEKTAARSALTEIPTDDREPAEIIEASKLVQQKKQGETIVQKKQGESVSRAVNSGFAGAAAQEKSAAQQLKAPAQQIRAEASLPETHA